MLGDLVVFVEFLDIYVGEGVDVIEIGMVLLELFLDGVDVCILMVCVDCVFW